MSEHRMAKVSIKDGVRRTIRMLAAVMMSANVAAFAAAQSAPPKHAEATPAAASSTVERATSGDSPDDPGPLATDLSPAITHADVRKAAKKVADWELARAQPVFNTMACLQRRSSQAMRAITMQW